MLIYIDGGRLGEQRRMPGFTSGDDEETSGSCGADLDPIVLPNIVIRTPVKLHPQSRDGSGVG
jgi:hypothetical protein